MQMPPTSPSHSHSALQVVAAEFPAKETVAGLVVAGVSLPKSSSKTAKSSPRPSQFNPWICRVTTSFSIAWLLSQLALVIAHCAHMLGSPVQVYPASSAQRAEQPSPETALLSSQSSLVSIMPLPHSEAAYPDVSL